jgi:hypothetical protein
MQQVMLESLTGDDVGSVAVDVEGRYYLKTDGGWTLIDASRITTTTQHRTGLIINEEPEEKADCDVTTVTIEGILTIETTVIAEGTARDGEIVDTCTR